MTVRAGLAIGYIYDVDYLCPKNVPWVRSYGCTLQKASTPLHLLFTARKRFLFDIAESIYLK